MSNQTAPQMVDPHSPQRHRRLVILSVLGTAIPVTLLTGCSPEPVSFKSTDVTDAEFAKKYEIPDHLGKTRTLDDFKGKIVVMFFGFTQCPDVCPTSMATLSEVKQLLGPQGDKLQVLFVTVDPERDTPDVLKAYMGNFDASFLALRPDSQEQLVGLAKEFKIYYKKVDGRTATSYTMDHSAGKYIFDTAGRVRLFSQYGSEAKVIAADIETLLKNQ